VNGHCLVFRALDYNAPSRHDEEPGKAEVMKTRPKLPVVNTTGAACCRATSRSNGEGELRTDPAAPGRTWRHRAVLADEACSR
jgi:hypothetical protein